jgi:hypothetical protein
VGLEDALRQRVKSNVAVFDRNGDESERPSVQTQEHVCVGEAMERADVWEGSSEFDVEDCGWCAHSSSERIHTQARYRRGERGRERRCSLSCILLAATACWRRRGEQ